MGRGADHIRRIIVLSLFLAGAPARTAFYI
ncbi:hypothetical protein EV679_1997 [Kerstersia gyiorum]|uniref:Uncharacterized protein n=1 Tax=Kerstersia gyiorum TaxID=206506 RepID=A0A4Q7MNX8_9BURK|nr:hypothetical protein EV679_1997 [Kerstersia gyiorum]